MNTSFNYYQSQFTRIGFVIDSQMQRGEPVNSCNDDYNAPAIQIRNDGKYTNWLRISNDQARAIYAILNK